MRSDVQFSEENPKSAISLVAIGQGFVPVEDMAVLSDFHKCEKIEHEQEQFEQKALGKSPGTKNRKSRDERPFVNKTQFVLGRENRYQLENLLVDLLADQTTLFSRDYQIFATDHPTYLELRQQQVNGNNEQLQLCINKALSEAPGEEKARYKKILSLIVERAEQDSKPLTKLEQQIIDAVVNWKITSQELEDFLCWAKENVKVDEVLNAVKKLLPSWEVTRQEADYLLRGCLQEDGRTGMGLLHFYRKFCAYFTPYGEARVVDWLNQWISGLELCDEDTQPFVSGVLEPFFASIRALSLDKEAAGHHKAQYRECDLNAVQSYLERKKCLEKVLEQYRAYKKESNDLSAFESLKDPVLDSTCYFEENVQGFKSQEEKGRTIEKIIQVTKDYLSGTRGGANRFSESIANAVVMEMLSNNENKIAQFPIQYLMVCVASSSQLFSIHRSLHKKTVRNALEKPYQQKPDKSIQRIIRIRFLDELHKICKLKKDDQSANWKCFLHIHGSEILSFEEADLWRTIIYGDKYNFYHPSVDIPPIELSLLCSEYLQTCLQIQPEYMYGYQGGSVLHQGGFAQFLREYPDVLADCVERIKQRPERWEKNQKRYLKLWSAIPCDLSEIKDLCKQGCKLIRWGTIPNASKEEMRDFCQLLHKNKVGEKQIASDIEELKMLIVEAALRTVLTEQARIILARKIEKAWNKGADFKFQVIYWASKK